tara:strand:+ start:1131 stop:2267 length:1137 start_codon:yes stop_codon:yes gene_type:complete
MAIYKIFPTKDTTLYSEYLSMNTGLDAILEASNVLDIAGIPVVSRYLIEFDTPEIEDIITNKISGSSFDVFLKNSISTAQGINADIDLEIFAVAQSWNNGTGHYLDSPIVTDGASWSYRNFLSGSAWTMTGSFPEGAGSGIYGYGGDFDSTYTSLGGGAWFTSSALIPQITESFGLRSNKDLELNVKGLVNLWYSGSIPNYGFLTKLSSSFEFHPSSSVQPVLKYYSVDTNTIYPPQLEFRWRDYSQYDPLSIVTTTQLKLSLDDNPGEFHPSSVNRFYVNVSPLYPTRTYKTSSLFTDTNYLPTSSFYAIKDLSTNEFVINFDDQYTQISSDERGNYFDVYMSGLEPERYYKILIKTNINGSVLILDDDYYFKVING